MSECSFSGLLWLNESDVQLADEGEDVRGRRVIDSNGEPMGAVGDVAVDEVHGRVRLIKVVDQVWGAGEAAFLVPVEAVVRVSSDSLRLDRDRDQVAEAPKYDRNLDDPENLSRIYHYFGYRPFWRAGHEPPPHFYS